jgi:hypothetical protein
MVLQAAARAASVTIYEQKNTLLRDYVAARWLEPYTLFA